MLNYFFRQSWKLMLLATAAGLVSGFSGASLIKIISEGVNGTHPLHSQAWLFFGLCASYLAFKVYSEITLMHLTQGAIHHLRINLSRKLLATPFKKLQALGKPELLAILTNDIGTFIQALQTVPMAFGNAVIIVGCMGYMAWLSWQLFLISTVCLGVGLAAYHFAERIPLAYMFKLREQMDVLYRDFRDLIEGSKELKLNARRGSLFVDKVVAPDSMAFKQLYLTSMKRYTWIANIGNVLFYVLIGILLFVIPAWFPANGTVLTAFTLVLLFLVRPINELLFALPMIRQASVSLRKIEQLEGELDSEEALQSGDDPFLSDEPLALELKNVCHRYPGDTDDRQFMLGPIDLTVKKGEIIFIVGGNGSGKTTLAMLLSGMYEPEQGAIRLNGTWVNRENIDRYRQNLSVVFSDFHLFEQLLGADHGELHEKAMHYVEKFGMAHKVKVKDGKFSTLDLSTGQRKRLALVSSYLEDRPIYLFDEWAADQDPAFKRVFYTELLPELKARGKTVLVITHDDAYFSAADRIVKIEEGRLHSINGHHESGGDSRLVSGAY